VKNKLTLAVVLLTVLALPSCCRWCKKNETVTEVRTMKMHDKMPNSKEVVEEAGYAETDGYDNERMAN